MSTNQSSRESWRKFLGIKDPSSTLAAGRIGGEIGRTAGRSGGAGGGGSLDSDSVPEGEDSESAEKGDGAADAGKQLKVGDELDRLEDLFDCETGEEVTIDGFGDKGSERYPTGFQDCNADGGDGCKAGYYWVASGNNSCQVGQNDEVQLPEKPFNNLNNAKSYVKSLTIPPSGLEVINSMTVDDIRKTPSAGGSCPPDIPNNKYPPYTVVIERRSCSSQFDEVCNEPCKPNWPAVDRNHLTWNKEKGCFEPLCPELNNQVLDKYKACEEERILCDKDGNKVKVTVDGDTVKVTQAKYNQTAEIKDGKVQTVKKLSESQTEAEFK